MEERYLAKRKLLAGEKVELLAGELPRIFSIRRMYLFGSLVDGHFHSLSDIDIAVEGLDDIYHLKAFTIAEEIARPFRLDLVLMEEAPLSLKNKVRERGVVVFEQGKNQCLPGIDR
ncbi:MAG TPA: nucleotidyltransferase domain-containing protein [Spirochaetia bacterium]|nr:nucleotidyltransferase domain-containing protein [Spirochaetia bacterium]